ncbi:expressed unknown protein [Seminavis robusta]|uniref:Uncharacterized protein n=1 Tax=Seminavis robusta TaxID=568900 RepID=A0A9N8HJH1_9STRA|nr:expressed unknown protein [Seminavis robusta]|eukprot:Sro661_g183250.1 n/a (206) ;mRNA; f:41665-42399
MEMSGGGPLSTSSSVGGLMATLAVRVLLPFASSVDNSAIISTSAGTLELVGAFVLPLSVRANTAVIVSMGALQYKQKKMRLRMRPSGVFILRSLENTRKLNVPADGKRIPYAKLSVTTWRHSHQNPNFLGHNEDIPAVDFFRLTELFLSAESPLPSFDRAAEALKWEDTPDVWEALIPLEAVTLPAYRLVVFSTRHTLYNKNPMF